MLTPALMAKLTARVLKAQPFKSVLIFDDDKIRHEGTRGSANSTRTYRPEGYSAAFACAWIGNASEFPVLPKVGKLATVDSQRLEVSTLPEVDPAGGTIRIDFRTPSTVAG